MDYAPSTFEDAYAAMRCWLEQPPYQDEDMMKIGDMIESKYLKQSDVDDVVTVTVQSLKKVNVARDDEDPDYKWTVKFNEFPKAMVMNVTNLKRMAKALGDDSDDWIDGTVQLYVDPDIEFGGNVVGGLRIRGILKQKTSAVYGKKPSDDDVNHRLQQAADDDIPF